MWQEKPEVVLLPVTQRELDKSLDKLSESEQIRLARQLRSDDRGDVGESNSVALSVAIIVVVTDEKVLLVCRRDVDLSGISWQFSAGIVKPGVSAQTIAMRETLVEMGVHCSIRQYSRLFLGSFLLAKWSRVRLARLPQCAKRARKLG